MVRILLGNHSGTCMASHFVVELKRTQKQRVERDCIWFASILVYTSPGFFFYIFTNIFHIFGSSDIIYHFFPLATHFFLTFGTCMQSHFEWKKPKINNIEFKSRRERTGDCYRFSALNIIKMLSNILWNFIPPQHNIIQIGQFFSLNTLAMHDEMAHSW